MGIMGLWDIFKNILVLCCCFRVCLVLCLVFCFIEKFLLNIIRTYAITDINILWYYLCKREKI